MSIQFSDTVNNLGIVQQARFFTRVDSSQWPTYKIVNSCNNYLDECAGYLIGSDKRFQWDDTNHTKIPEATTPSVSGQSDYSYLTDEQGNSIITLTGVSRLDSATSNYIPLTQVDRNDTDVDLTTFGTQTGTPTRYDKIADNIVRLDLKVGSVISAYLKFFFQRTPSYFVATDTTKAPGVSPLLHRGFVIASAYDIALTLGLANVSLLAGEMEKERQKMISRYSGSRNRDDKGRMRPSKENNR